MSEESIFEMQKRLITEHFIENFNKQTEKENAKFKEIMEKYKDETLQSLTLAEKLGAKDNPDNPDKVLPTYEYKQEPIDITFGKPLPDPYYCGKLVDDAIEKFYKQIESNNWTFGTFELELKELCEDISYIVECQVRSAVRVKVR